MIIFSPKQALNSDMLLAARPLPLRVARLRAEQGWRVLDPKPSSQGKDEGAVSVNVRKMP